MTDLVFRAANIDRPTLAEWMRLTDEWLANRRLSDQSRRAYRVDISTWLDWCRREDLDPRAARFTHVNSFGRELETEPTARTGKPMAPASVARRMSAVSSWYEFLRKLGIVAANPVIDADRPAVDRDHSTTVGLTVEQAAAILAASDADTNPAAVRTRALVRVLILTGIRVDELCNADVDAYGHRDGHQVLTVLGKGRKRRTVPVPPLAVDAVNRYLAGRGNPTGGPLFATSSGGRIDQQYVMRLVRRLAVVARIPSADRISPHSFRHACATIARQGGATLDEIQDLLGHADPRTTRRYMRASERLENSPVYAVAQLLAKAGAVGF